MKKIISIILSLGIAATASAGVLAYTDIEGSSQAIDELTNLGIVAGYENGEFRPDNPVTRAEITKMIVAARNENVTVTDTKFADTKGHWAAGYVEQGVIDGFIDGYTNVAFGPDDKVTYVQAQKMLVAALGYGQFAENAGGWPNGYKSYAANLGITDGVSAMDTDNLNRAQVAQMIDNSLDVPICVSSTGYYYEILDGQGKNYQTLLTSKFDAYKVNGRVVETYKSSGSLEPDEVVFRVEKADNFNDEHITKDTYVEEIMNIGVTNADELVDTYVQAIVQKDDNDEFTIISITPTSGATQGTIFMASDIDNSKTDLDNHQIYFYTPDGRSSVKYNLADEVACYVNDVYMGNFTIDEYEKYIYDKVNDRGYDSTTIILSKEKSKYDTIKIITYETFVVDEVNKSNVIFKEQSTNGTLKLDEDKQITIYLDNEEIDVRDLRENDVLSITYDYTGSFNDSKFYDIIVSRDTIQGKCTAIKDDGYEIDGTLYTSAKGIDPNIELSNTYVIYLDAYGNIAMAEEELTAKKIGILENIYKADNGDYKAQVITKEGKEVEFEVDNEDYLSYIQEGNKLNTYPQQVIEYSTKSNNRLNIKEVIAAGAVEVDTAYKESSQRVGSVRMSDSTIIIDISEIERKDTFTITSVDSLVDNNNYTMYGYDKGSDGTYRFVILTSGVGGVNSTTQLAIFDDLSTVSVDGDERYQYNVLIDDKEASYVLDEDVEIVTGEAETDFCNGDVIVFSTNAEGEISEVYNVFQKVSIVDSEDYESFREKIFENQDLITVELNTALSDNNDDVSLYFGAVVNKTGSTITIGSIEDGKVDYNSGIEVDTNNATIYTYAFNGGRENLILDNGLQVTPDIKAAKDGDVLDLTHTDVYDNVVFGLVRAIDGDDAQEIYLIVNE